MRIPRFLLNEMVSVQPQTGVGGEGPIYGPTKKVPAHIQQNRIRVLSDQGEEVLSETQIYVDPKHETSFPVGSTVTVREDTTVVINARRLSVGRTSTHVEVVLQ